MVQKSHIPQEVAIYSWHFIWKRTIFAGHTHLPFNICPRCTLFFYIHVLFQLQKKSWLPMTRWAHWTWTKLITFSKGDQEQAWEQKVTTKKSYECLWYLAREKFANWFLVGLRYCTVEHCINKESQNASPKMQLWFQNKCQRKIECGVIPQMKRDLR